MYMAAAGSDAGICFRSYDEPAESRTSIILSGPHGSHLTFNNSLSFSFSLKADLDRGRFGYVFRLAVDDMQSVDFLLSPENGKPVYCITADHKKLIAMDGLVEDVEEWNDIYVDVVERGDSLVMLVDSRPVVSLYNTYRRHKARLFFGKVDEPGLVTSDVAPMSIADIHVSCDGNKKKAAWMLSGTEGLAPQHGICIDVKNPVFISGLGDRWTKLWSADLPSTSYICLSRDTSRFFIISSDQLIEYDIIGGKDSVRPFSADMDIRKVTGEFLCLPDGDLCYADMETGEMIRYDNATNDWTAANAKERVSVHLHHNIVYMDSTSFQMFGYGQHRYSSEIFAWTPARGLEGNLAIGGLAPRYLAGAAAMDGKIYVLGGKGNVAGLQELGTGYYDTFTEIDPEAGTASELWSNPLLKTMVPAKDLVFDDNGKTFLALLYNPETNDSSLQLTRFRTSDGKSEALLPPLPYRFTDIYSDARLCYNKERDIYLAILCYRSESGQDKADVYILGNPIVPAEGSKAGRAVLPVLVLIVLSASAGWLIRRNRMRKTEKASVMSTEAAAVQEYTTTAAGLIHQAYAREDPVKDPGIRLLGGFHVFDTTGTEITTSFSPILMQLLSIFILYTVEKGGVSNATLKELLWPDKPDDKFNNNKGVNIAKLRKLLASVGELAIVSEGGVWTIKDESGLCDIMEAKKMLNSGSITDILNAAMWGPLLPEYHFEWLDSFKSEYTDLVLSRLSDISRSAAPQGDQPDPEKMVQVADARLKFDSLDEEAVRQKCLALVTMGKAGTAKAVFGHFSEEYGSVMGEPFGINFSDFLKNISH